MDMSLVLLRSNGGILQEHWDNKSHGTNEDIDSGAFYTGIGVTSQKRNERALQLKKVGRFGALV